MIFLLDDHHDVEEALHGVEWDTLIFFAALFVMVEGLAQMGLLRMIGGSLASIIEELAPETRQVYAIILVGPHLLHSRPAFNAAPAPARAQLVSTNAYTARSPTLQINYVSAITSAFVDNIPFTTTMIPVIVRPPFFLRPLLAD